MEIGFQVKYWSRRVLLTFFGPAQLDAEHDPLRRLERTRVAHREELAAQKKEHAHAALPPS